MNAQNNTVSRYTISFGLAVAVASMVNALLVITKEKSRAVQNTMQKLTGHHWITHVAVVLFLFLGFGFLSARPKEDQTTAMPINRLIKIMIAGIVAAGVIIIAFYLTAD